MFSCFRESGPRSYPDRHIDSADDLKHLWHPTTSTCGAANSRPLHRNGWTFDTPGGGHCAQGECIKQLDFSGLSTSTTCLFLFGSAGTDKSDPFTSCIMSNEKLISRCPCSSIQNSKSGMQWNWFSASTLRHIIGGLFFGRNAAMGRILQQHNDRLTSGRS